MFADINPDGVDINEEQLVSWFGMKKPANPSALRKPLVSPRSTTGAAPNDTNNSDAPVVLMQNQDKVNKLEVLLRSDQMKLKNARALEERDTVLNWEVYQISFFRASLAERLLENYSPNWITTLLKYMPSDTEGTERATSYANRKHIAR